MSGTHEAVRLSSTQHPFGLCYDGSLHNFQTDSEGNYGLWDDPIWVDYPGISRFLEDDIVTVWGTVTGLQKYKAVLGNNVTIPQIEAAPICRGGPGTTYPLAGGVDEGQALTIIARNADGSWYQLADGKWIAAFLVTNGPAAAALPLAPDIPAAPSAPVAESSGAAAASAAAGASRFLRCTSARRSTSTTIPRSQWGTT